VPSARATLASLHDALLKEAEIAVITFVEPDKHADTLKWLPLDRQLQTGCRRP
jgi:hypothetical protein